MPNLDKRGPMGEGPMTGRRMGRCTNMGVGRRRQIIEENECIDNQINDNLEGEGFGRGRRRRMRGGLGSGMGQNRRIRGRMGRGGGGAGRGMGQRFRDNV